MFLGGLILSMQRIIQGGAFIMLLHKIGCWAVAGILYAFSKFPKGQVVTQDKKHNPLSPFHMVKNAVNFESPDVATAVDEERRCGVPSRWFNIICQQCNGLQV